MTLTAQFETHHAANPSSGDIDDTVCVIIAARNAADTIRLAIASALRERLVSEVIVVDDASTDTTSAATMAADDETGRLKLISLKQNVGPARARNLALDQSSASLIAILDADDFFIPDRFASLLAAKDWDFVADNIVFIDQQRRVDPDSLTVPRFSPEPRFLSLAAFVDRNISRRGKPRGELGFLKPVMRRGFLEKHGLKYNEKLRLGEDYDLYTRALALGARFKVVNTCGYGAIVRANSLSGRHGANDLKQLADADLELLKFHDLPDGARRSVEVHEKHIRGKYQHRHFLDIKAQGGIGAAISYVASNPFALPAIAKGILTDKTDLFVSKRTKPAPTASRPTARFLFPGRVEIQK
ncbi:MAG: glycosyltransferase family 2 protein [Phyllobacterium sp.]